MSLIFSLPPSVPSSRRNGIYIGGKDDAKNRSKLEQWGVTHVLNMTPVKDSSIQSGIANYFEKKKAFAYKRIPVYDASTSNLLTYAPEIVSFISKGLNYGSVLVHCRKGVSRSATAVLFYLMFAQGMELDSAVKLVQRRRPCINPIPAFMKQLQGYEIECKEKGLICEVEVKVKSGQDADSRKRKAIGPICGPVPSNQQSVIGPSLNVNVTKLRKTNDTNDTFGKIIDSNESIQDDNRKEKSKKNAAAPIGPSLPPGFKRAG